MKNPVQFSEPPEVSRNRRKRFAELVDLAGGATRVAKKSGISRVHIEKLSIEPTFNQIGQPTSREILALRKESIAGLLEALNLSDSAAIRELNIPKHLQPRWHTSRPEPMGHGKGEDIGLVTYVLSDPLVITLQPGHLITVDPNNELSGDILVVLNGKYHVLPHETIPAHAEVVGQFVGADALIRRPVPEP